MKQIIVLLAFAVLAAGQTPGKGTVERIKVHGKSLEGNLEGDSPDREVMVYVPPSYQTAASRRYPVLYLLHGYTDNAAKWFGFEKHWISFPPVMDEALAQGATKEMIVVMPDAYTRFKGSMYSTSVTTGDWDDYVARELVAYIDAHYRTIPDVASRGLAGHSMGGYGAIRIGMKHPDVFSSIYLLSPCCMGPTPNIPKNAAQMAQIDAVKTFDDVAKAGFLPSAILASAAAWSPDPKNPPFYVALPWHNGQPDPAIEAKFAANAPLAMIDQYIPRIKALHAIAFDAGDKDTSIAAAIKILDGVLSSYGIAHTYEQYEGDHLNRIADRLRTKALPFFRETCRLKLPDRRYNLQAKGDMYRGIPRVCRDFGALVHWQANCSMGGWSGGEMNNAIDHYILHEISELRCEEKRLNAALLGAPQDSSSDPFMRALARLQARAEELDWVLDQLDVVAVTEPAAA